MGRRPPDATETVRGVQRARFIAAVTEIVCNEGLESVTVAQLTATARVSRSVFYQLFGNCEACLLAAFDSALARVSARVRYAYQAGDDWLEGVRAALLELLVFLDEDRQLARFLVVRSLGGTPDMLARRASVLTDLAAALDEGREHAPWATELPAMTAESVVGAILSVLYGRLLEPAGERLTVLWGPLMGVIALPYRGPAAARDELALVPPPGPRATPRSTGDRHALLDSLRLRATYRTLRVLSAIAERPGASNIQVAERAGITDAGQVSKLLARLSGLGLIANTRTGEPKHAQKAWRLTPLGVSAQAAMGDLLPGAQ